MVGAFLELVIGLFLLGSAVGPQDTAPSQDSTRAGATETTDGNPYVVGPGDVLAVTVVGESDLSRSNTVQPSGLFTLPLLGEVEVSGKTVPEIQKLITELLSRDFLVDPRVSVRVAEYKSQFALVLGEVASPARRALRGNTRLIDLLIESGGFTAGASGEVLVQRTEGTFPTGEKFLRFRLGRTGGMSEADRLNAELVLRNGDVVTASPKSYVTVDGTVGRPGRILIDNDLTLLGVIAESGGLGRAGSSKVLIIRKNLDGRDLTGFGPCKGPTQDVCREVDINDIRKGKVQDVLMAPNDKVVISRRRF